MVRKRNKPKCVSTCFEENWKKNFPLNSECGPNHNCCGPCGPHGCRCFCGVTCHGPLCCCPPDYRYFTCHPEPQYPYTQSDYNGAVGGMTASSCGCVRPLDLSGIARYQPYNNFSASRKSARATQITRSEARTNNLSRISSKKQCGGG